MGTEAKVTSKGQITLPAKLRAEFGIEPGDVVLFFRDLDDRPTFRVRHSRRGAISRASRIPASPISQADLDEGISRAVVEDFEHADRDRRRGKRDEE